MKITDTTGLTVEQRGALAAGLEVIRCTMGSLRGWTQFRVPPTGTPRILYLQKWRKGKIEQVYFICRDALPPSK